MEPRLRRLKAWFSLRYTDALGNEDRKAFIADTGKHGYDEITKGLVTQWLGKNGKFGEGAAKKLGLRLGLGEDYFLEDRPEFGAAPAERSRIQIETTVLTDLRDIEKINPQTYAAILRDLHDIAQGARASHRLISGKTSKGYATPEAAHANFGKVPGSTHSNDKAPSHDRLLGSASDFGELQEAEDQPPAKTPSKRK